jgi:hypothetical protein
MCFGLSPYPTEGMRLLTNFVAKKRADCVDYGRKSDEMPNFGSR